MMWPPFGQVPPGKRPDDEPCPARSGGLEHAANSMGKCRDCGAPLYWRSKAKALGLGDDKNAPAPPAPVEPDPAADPMAGFTPKQRNELGFLRAIRDRLR